MEDGQTFIKAIGESAPALLIRPDSLFPQDGSVGQRSFESGRLLEFFQSGFECIHQSLEVLGKGRAVRRRCERV